MKRLCACLSVLLLFTALFCALPAFAATEIKIEAEQPDEWGGWAGVPGSSRHIGRPRCSPD